MPNAMQIPISKAKDRLGQALVCKFKTGGDGYEKSTAARYCTHIVRCAGAPSYAMIAIPMKNWGPGQWDELKPTCAMLRTGPAGDIKLLARVSCGYFEDGGGYDYQCLLNGWVTYETHTWNEKEDSILACVFDDFWVMSKYTVFGRMTWNPNTLKHCFNTNNSDRTVFNQYGHGNAIQRPNGSVRFCEGHRFGHVAGSSSDPSEDPAPGSSEAESKSRKWTCSDIIDYLRDMFYDTARRPKIPNDRYGLMQLPDSILWPKGIGNALGENRTPRDMSLWGMDLFTALRTVVRYAGPYDISLVPVNDFQSELRIINYAPKRNTGIIVYGQGYGVDSLGDAMSSASYVKRGWVKESALGYFDNVVNMGDAPSVELMASTYATGDGAADLQLERGWDTATDVLAKAYIQSRGDTAAAFAQAIQLYPDWLNFHRIKINRNPFEGTKWASLSNDGYLRIKPHQLTSYNSSATSPLGLIPREVIVEYKLTDKEFDAITDPDEAKRGRWRYAGRYTDLQLSPCGRYLQIPAVRDAIQSWYTAVNAYGDTLKPDGVTTVGQYEGAYIRAREIRVQLAVEHEHALVAYAGGGDADPYGTLCRIDSGAPKWSYQIPHEPMQYVDWLRRADSWPCGLGGLTPSQRTTFPSRATAGNELFTDHIGDGDLTNPKNRLARHADILLKNVKRVSYEGQFVIGRMAPCYSPGQPIRYENGDPLPCFGVIKCVVWDREAQETQIEFGPNEWSAIWDGPIKVMSMNNGSGGGGPPGKPYDEDTPKSGGGNPTPSVPTGGGPNTPTDSGGAGSTQGSQTSVALTQGETTDDGTGTGKTVQEYSGTMTQSPGELKQTSPNETPAGAAAAAPAAPPMTPKQAKAARMAERRAENKDQLKADKAEQRSNKGSMNGKSDITDSFLGAATSGTINGKSDITDSFYGASTSGSMTQGKNRVEAGELGKLAEGMVDTRRANAHDNDFYLRRRNAENATNRASMDKFSKTGWGGTEPKPTPLSNPALNPMASGFPMMGRHMQGGPAASRPGVAPAARPAPAAAPAASRARGLAKDIPMANDE